MDDILVFINENCDRLCQLISLDKLLLHLRSSCFQNYLKPLDTFVSIKFSDFYQIIHFFMIWLSNSVINCVVLVLGQLIYTKLLQILI
jgi:hypothetical protein